MTCSRGRGAGALEDVLDAFDGEPFGELGAPRKGDTEGERKRLALQSVQEYLNIIGEELFNVYLDNPR